MELISVPKSQVQNIYGNAKNIKDNSKPKEKSKPQEVKKPQKKAEKSQEPTKPKPPKSIESALNSVCTNPISFNSPILIFGCCRLM